jgi:RNAse (barnase) inhibitor barstar
MFVKCIMFIKCSEKNTMRYCKIIGMFCIAGLMVTGLASAQTAEDESINAYIDLMRKDIRTKKQSIVDQAMGLEAGQKAQFWGIYEGYQKELDALWDQRIANVKKYADNFDNMTDAVADQLATTMLNLEQKRSELKKKYYTTYKEKMGARVAARFLQVETTLSNLIDSQLGAEIPILH